MATNTNTAKSTAKPTAKANGKAATKPKTRKLPAASKTSKSEQSETWAHTSADIRMIPLDQLTLSPKNVRKVKPSEADDAELLASIRAQGVKQNLAGYEHPEGGYLIDAGGRRLKALQQLAEEGAIAKDHLVPCLIEDESEATLTSTTENMARAAMHPADEFDAFAKMIGEGRSEDEIARRFGVSEDLVRRRLKLARIAPEIFEAFREGQINLECVIAFTLTDHHDRQMTVWGAVKDSHHVYPQHIKRLLTETSYAANSKLGQFVGLEAYEAAGGVVMRDLFADRDTTYLENPELVERLAIEKLQKTAEAYVGDWKWVDVHLELDHGAFRSFGRVYPQDVEPDPKLVAESEKLSAREEELAMLNDEGGWSDAEDEEYHAIAPRLEEIEEEIEAARPYTDDHRAIAGVVLSVGWQGELQVEKGLVRPEDIPASDPKADDADGDGTMSQGIAAPTSSSPAPVADPAAALRKADGITNGLADDLRTTRHHILRAHLSADYDVAFDIMLYTLCEQAFSLGYSNAALDLSLRQFYAPNREKLVADSTAEKMLEALENDLRVEWMELEQPEDFRAMSALPAEDKQALFAWATGLALKAQLASDNRPSAVIEELGARMEVAVAACWRPTAANYWGTVTKAHIASVAKDIIGTEFADERAHEKKGEAAAAMDLAFSENAAEAAGLEPSVTAKTTTWLPKGMGFAGVTGTDAPVDAPSDNASANDAFGDDLPAFLKDDAAA